MYKTKITLTILLCLTIIPNAYSKGDNIKSIVVLPFNFKNSAKIKSQAKSLHAVLESKLYATKKYRLIDQKIVGLLGQIQNASIFNEDSEKDTAKIGNFLKIDYIVMGDVLNNKILIIKIIDTNRKNVFFTRIYDFDKNLLTITDVVSKDINAKMQDYTFKPFNIYAKYSYFIPLNDLAESVDGGHGGGVGIAYELPWVPNLLVGAEIQYFYLNGKTYITHHSTLVPMTAFVEYQFEFGKFYATPRLSIGMSYNSLYYYEDAHISNDYTERSSYDTTFKFGVNVGYNVNYLISLFVGVDYGLFYYEIRDNRFCILSLGFNVNF